MSRTIDRFNSFSESENSETYHLLYYSFDWDDNILYMPTVIHMDKLEGEKWIPVDVSTKDFAEVRFKEDYRIRNNNPDDAFSDFRDDKNPNIFIEDIKKVIFDPKSHGPSWNDFIECLTNATLFSIITARGHESVTLRRGVEFIIDNILTSEQIFELYNNLLKFNYLFRRLKDASDNRLYFISDSGESIEISRILKESNPSKNVLVSHYLDMCDFVGISAPSRGGSPSNPEKAKEDALMNFIDKVDGLISELKVKTGRDWKGIIGFSDDDIKNKKHIEDLIHNLHHERFSNVSKIVVKGTKDPLNITKSSRIFKSKEYTQNLEEAADSTIAAGMASSVMPFSQFNNMNDRMFTNNQEYDKSSRLGSQQLAKMSKEIIKPIKKKRKKSKK